MSAKSMNLPLKLTTLNVGSWHNLAVITSCLERPLQKKLPRKSVSLPLRVSH